MIYSPQCNVSLLEISFSFEKMMCIFRRLLGQNVQSRPIIPELYNLTRP